jgi:hypothetical protein
MPVELRQDGEIAPEMLQRSSWEWEGIIHYSSLGKLRVGFDKVGPVFGASWLPVVQFRRRGFTSFICWCYERGVGANIPIHTTK